MTFDTASLLTVAPLIALIIAGLGYWARAARVRRSDRWSQTLGAQARRNGRFGPVAIAFASLAALVALAGPRWGGRFVIAETKGLNLVIAMDVSRSMLAEDAGGPRLDRSKREAKRLIWDLRSDHLGLIAFAGQSFIMSPLTADGSALQLLVDALDPDIASSGGTELANVLRQGRQLLLTRASVADRILVVFTDGEAHDSLRLVQQEAERLRRDGVHLIMVAEGGTNLTRIPMRNPRGDLAGYYKDADGSFVLTSRRDDLMAAVADAAHGAVVAAEITDQAGAVRDLVDGYKRAPQATTTTAQNVLRSWIPTMFAVVVLLVHTLTRSSAALAALAFLITSPALTLAQSPRNRADDAWSAGNVAAAARGYLAQVRAGEGGDTALYNVGTAAVALGDTALARQALERAAESFDPDVRFSALYNLGLLSLRLARIDSPNEEAHLARARRAYREALLLRPGDRAAKWNLELTIRRAPPQGDGSAQQQQPQDSQGRGQRDSGLSRSDITRAQAEQILNSVSEEERQTRERLNRRRLSGDTLGEKDW